MGDARERALTQVDGVSVIVIRAWDHEVRRAVRCSVDVSVVLRMDGSGMNVIDVETACLLAEGCTVQV